MQSEWSSQLEKGVTQPVDWEDPAWWTRRRALHARKCMESQSYVSDSLEEWRGPSWATTEGTCSMRHAYARWCTSFVVWWLERRWKGWRAEEFVDGVPVWEARGPSGRIQLDPLMQRAVRLTEPGAGTLVPVRYAAWLVSVIELFERDFGTPDSNDHRMGSLTWESESWFLKVKSAMRHALRWAPSPERRLLARYVRCAGFERKPLPANGAINVDRTSGLGGALASAWIALRARDWPAFASHSQQAAARDPYSLIAQTLLLLAGCKVEGGELVGQAAQRLERLAWPGDRTWMWILLAGPSWFEPGDFQAAHGIEAKAYAQLPLRAQQLMGAFSLDR